MPDVTVHVMCHNCEPDDDGARLEMKGAAHIFENKDARTQSRLYVCPECDSHVSVILDFRGN